MPGQPMPGQPMPGQPMPGQPMPGQPMPGQPMPGQPMPGQPMPGMPVGGTVAVTLTANSNPPGATVLRPTGEVLGTTPLVSQVNLPANQLGLPQTFTFNLTGYQPSTATAVAVNNAIQVQANLTPMGGPATPGAPGMPGMPGMPRTLTVNGGGGGAIYDMHTTTARANVNQPCIVQSMRISVRGRHSYHSDLTVRLNGPNGQTATLQRRRRSNPFRSYTINRAAGTQAQGVWRLSIRDDVRADSGSLNGFTIHLTCL